METDVLDLARPELRSIIPYTPGVYEPGLIRMNANESPYGSSGDDTKRGLNRYPPPRPYALRACLASHYNIHEEEMLITRGSSEAIDVLIRAFCTAGKDSIVISPPTPEPMITPILEELAALTFSPECLRASLAAITPNLENRSHLLDSFGSKMPVGSKFLTSAAKRQA